MQSLAIALLISLLLFSPGFAQEVVQERDPNGIRVSPDIVYARKLGLALTLDLYQPRQPTGGVVLFINSGGFVSGKFHQYEELPGGGYRCVQPEELLLVPEKFHYPPLAQFSCRELLAAGITVCDVRHGGSPRFTLDEIVADLKLALDYVRNNAEKLAIDPRRIGLFGASAGGYLASYLALTDKWTGGSVAAVAMFYPGGWNWVRDLEDHPELHENLPSLHLPPEQLLELSLAPHVGATAPPHLIVYGGEDFPFIISTCDSLYSALREQGVVTRRLKLEGIGHEFRAQGEYDTRQGKQARVEMSRWFAELLR